MTAWNTLSQRVQDSNMEAAQRDALAGALLVRDEIATMGSAPESVSVSELCHALFIISRDIRIKNRDDARLLSEMVRYDPKEFPFHARELFRPIAAFQVPDDDISRNDEEKEYFERMRRLVNIAKVEVAILDAAEKALAHKRTDTF